LRGLELIRAGAASLLGPPIGDELRPGFYFPAAGLAFAAEGDGEVAQIVSA
jgi:hypothetical protein